MFVGKDVAIVLLYNNLFVFLFIVYSIIYSTYDNTFRHYWHIQSIPMEYKSSEAITVVVLYTIYMCRIIVKNNKILTYIVMDINYNIKKPRIL